MVSVGIIANPASGQDIRRLLTQASTFGNDEKVRIVRRLLVGLEATGVDEILVMPDSYGIGLRVREGVRSRVAVRLLEMEAHFDQDDSRRAAELMATAGVGCLVTLGGDGTNRVVARGSGTTPLLPISTGTNNVFPMLIEATTAGLAAGLVACGLVREAVRPAPIIEIIRDLPGAAPAPVGAPPDEIALIDAAIYDDPFIAARAVWDSAKIRAVLSTRAEAGTIGLSSIAGHLIGSGCPAGHGLWVRLGAGGEPVTAPIAPGLIQTVGIVEQRLLAPNEEVAYQPGGRCVLALDGERELELPPGSTVRLRINPLGPRVVDARQTLALAARAGLFRRPLARPNA